MESTPKKLHFRNGSRNYIRYDGKPKMVIEVFEFSDMDAVDQASSKTIDELKTVDLPFIGSVTEWNGMFYLLIATQFPNGAPTVADQREADQLARIMRKLADWYRYTVLNAQAN